MFYIFLPPHTHTCASVELDTTARNTAMLCILLLRLLLAAAAAAAAAATTTTTATTTTGHYCYDYYWPLLLRIHLACRSTSMLTGIMRPLNGIKCDGRPAFLSSLSMGPYRDSHEPELLDFIPYSLTSSLSLYLPPSISPFLPPPSPPHPSTHLPVTPSPSQP